MPLNSVTFIAIRNLKLFSSDSLAKIVELEGKIVIVHEVNLDQVWILILGGIHVAHDATSATALPVTTHNALTQCSHQANHAHKCELISYSEHFFIS